MKSASPELQALLDDDAFLMADLYTLTLKVGGVLYYTSADIPLTWAGHTYTPITVERGNTGLVAGIEVDSMSVEFTPWPEHTLAGNPFLASVVAGVLDGAEIKVERAYLADWRLPVVGALHRFEGAVSDVELDGITAKLRVVSLLSVLNVKMPRNVYQAACANSLYDAGCGVSKAAFGAAGTIQSGATQEVLVTNLSQTAGYFDQGMITFLTGANAGQSRTVKTHASGVLTLANPLRWTPAVGDTFTVWPGCDKTMDTCANRFSNLSKFRGFPWIPVPESAY